MEERRGDESHRHDHRPADDGQRDELPAREREDEADEVGGEREHPQQREGTDVRGDVAGCAEHQARRQRRHRDPAQAAAPGQRDRTKPGRRNDRAGGRRQQPEDAQGRQDGKDHVRDRPNSRLLGEGQPWLQQRRICEKPQQASRVRRGVEEIGIAGSRVAARGKPALEDRARAAGDEEREAGRQEQHAEQPDRRVRARRVHAARHRDGEQGERNDE